MLQGVKISPHSSDTRNREKETWSGINWRIPSILPATTVIIMSLISKVIDVFFLTSNVRLIYAKYMWKTQNIYLLYFNMSSIMFKFYGHFDKIGGQQCRFPHGRFARPWAGLGPARRFRAGSNWITCILIQISLISKWIDVISNYF